MEIEFKITEVEKITRVGSFKPTELYIVAERTNPVSRDFSGHFGLTFSVEFTGDTIPEEWYPNKTFTVRF